MSYTEEDFLARERELLGDDAQLFGNPLVGEAVAGTANTDGFVGGASGGDEFGAFDGGVSGGESFVPSSNLNVFGAVGNSVNVQQQQQMEFAFHPSGAATSGISAPVVPDAEAFAFSDAAEPEAVRAWRESFESAIADRDAKSSTKTAETIRAAQESLDRFYAEYNDKKNKAVARNKENEKAALAREEISSGNIWERVVKQIDTSAASNPAAAKLKEKIAASGKDDKQKKPAAPKAKDTSRMKSLLISLKSDKNAPSHDVQ